MPVYTTRLEQKQNKKKKGGKKVGGTHKETIEFCNYMAQLQIFCFQMPPRGDSYSG